MSLYGGAVARRLARQLRAVRRELEGPKAKALSDAQLAALELLLMALLELVRLYRKTRS